MTDFDSRCQDRRRLGQDLRTRLTVIRGYAQLLERRVRQTGDSDSRFLVGLAAIDGEVTAIGELIELFETTDPCDRVECPDIAFTDS